MLLAIGAVATIIGGATTWRRDVTVAMDVATLRELRLRVQGLRRPFDASAPEVVRRFVAVQAQEFVPAQWGLAARVPHDRRPDAAAVAAAIDDGEILRTHVLRPTWHFLHRDDARWVLELSAERVHRANAMYYRRTGLEGADVARAMDLVAAALERGGDEIDRARDIRPFEARSAVVHRVRAMHPLGRQLEHPAGVVAVQEVPRRPEHVRAQDLAVVDRRGNGCRGRTPVARHPRGESPLRGHELLRLHRDESPHDLGRRRVERAAQALHPQPEIAQRRDIHRYCHVPPPGRGAADDGRDRADGQQHEAALPPFQRAPPRRPTAML